MLERKRKRTPKSTIVFSEHTARLASVTPHQFGQWIVFPIFLKLIINKKSNFQHIKGGVAPFAPRIRTYVASEVTTLWLDRNVQLNNLSAELRHCTSPSIFRRKFTTYMHAPVVSQTHRCVLISPPSDLRHILQFDGLFSFRSVWTYTAAAAEADELRMMCDAQVVDYSTGAKSREESCSDVTSHGRLCRGFGGCYYCCPRVYAFMLCN